MTAFKKASNAGAKPKINRQMIKTITNAIRAGSYIETAVALAGVSKKTFYEWLKKSHEDGAEKMYIELRNAVNKSLAEAEIRDLMNIDKAAMGSPTVWARYEPGTYNSEGVDISGQVMTDLRGRPIPEKLGNAPDWHASAWRLERRFKKKWSSSNTTVHVENFDDDESEQEQNEIRISFYDKPVTKEDDQE